MSDEHFLSRWSRRKIEAEQNAGTPEPARDAPSEMTPPRDESGAAPQPGDPPVARAPRDPPLPAFDVNNLPSIDSIGAGTDVRVFLQPGVPAELARAALRRAWATDPNIRDYIGLSENSWDFTAPRGVPGFGPLSAEDAERLMAEFTGKSKQALERFRALAGGEDAGGESPQSKQEREFSERGRDGAARQVASRSEVVGEPTKLQSSGASHEPEFLRRDGDHAAMQNDDSPVSGNSAPIRRRHGSALPD